MRFAYQYPVVCLDEDDPEDAKIEQEQGYITPIRLDQEPYEANIEARGYCFHVLFGSQIHGNFLCIPNWNIGCELASLNDQGWNLHSLLETDRLDYEESTAIIKAIALLSGLVDPR